MEVLHIETGLVGQKGGAKKPRTPVETPNNLLSKSYAKVLLAVGEGEFAGTPTGSDIYLDGTPLVGPGGIQNFGGVKWEWRPGTVDQTHIQGLPEVSNEFPIGFNLTTATPWTRLITNPDLDAVRVTLSWPALYRQLSNGDIVGWNIEYAIDVSTDGGAYQEVGKWDTDSGKTNTEYNRTHRIDLPQSGSSWTIRVRRITADQSSSMYQDTMTVKTFAEVIDAKFRYPNTALLYVEFDAELFGGTSIPRISVKTKGRLIQVPTNYDPETRTYTGIWNGAFKWAWSDNPAWVFYDLVTNERFGLGSRISPDMVDKWTLYQIAQYCDVMVSDGAGGLEPRHTCNVYIQSRKEAWQVLRDIVAIFNGMLHWNGTQMVASADMPVDVATVRNYSRANVVDGKFTYGTPSERSVYTTALVSFDDPDNHYNTAIEAVNDLQLVQRWKTWSQAELTAIGCTSRGEAQRKGKYAMLTNSLNRIVNFKLGLEGYLPAPGEVIGVVDQLFMGAQLGGRIHAATLNTITVDRDTTAVAGDILYYNSADGKTAEGRTIASVAGRVITVTGDFSEVPEAQLSWYVEKSNLKSQLFRVVKVVWDDDKGEYEVTAAQYEDSKFAAVDNGARLEARPVTVVPAGGQEPPTNVVIDSFTILEQTLAVTTMTVRWDAVPGAMNYEAQWRKDGGDWKTVGLTSATGFDIKGIYSGDYQVRVRAINAISVKSVWTTTENTPLTGKVGAPPALASFTTGSEVFGIRLNWTFTEGSDDGAFIQLQEADDVNGANAIELGFQAYPTKTFLKSGMAAAVVRFFRARLIDRTGNEGPWSAWTYGISSANADEILDYLTGQITETELADELLSEIELISGIGPGSVNDRIQQSADALQGQIDGLQDQIDNFADALEYDPTKTYVLGDIVRVGQKLYQAKQSVPINTTPPNATYWNDVGTVVQSVDAIALQVSTNTTDISEIDGKVTAQASQLEGLRAAWRDEDHNGDLADALKLWQNTADIVTERTVRASQDEAFAQQITVLEASVADNTAQIITEQTVRADADSALATSITLLTAEVDENAAAILIEQTARADGDSALASSITALTAEVDENAAAILTEQTVRANADSALSTSISSVSAVANAKNKTYRQATAPASGMVTGDVWYDSGDGNKSYRYDGSSWVATDDTRIAANAAAIQTEETARANADSALASQITTVQASVDTKNKTYRQATAPTSGMTAGDLWIDSDDKNKTYRYSGSAWVLADNTDIAANSAAIQVQATALADLDGDLSAMYSIKLGINSGGQYYAAGMGIGIENTPAGMQSQVLFVADRFAIMHTINGTPVSPFIVQGGQAIINSAVIGNATIGFAKISDDVQSTNYVAGQTGWKLSKNGSLEFNGTVAGGGRLTINNQVVQVYDSAGTLRVRLGIW